MEALKAGVGKPPTETVIRFPALKFEIVRWDWSSGRVRDRIPIDITPAVTQFRWMKSTRNPSSGLELDMIPQFSDVHYLDSLSPMDVIKIYEFNTLKYQGFIRSISGSGSIDPSGKPHRAVHIRATAFGALFSEGNLGMNMFLKAGTFGKLGSNIETFATAIGDMLKQGASYATLIQSLVDEWMKYLEANGASKYKKYFEYWINVKTGVAGKLIPGSPRDAFMFSPSDQQISLWSIINKFVQAPFCEAWFDCGPRKVFIEKSESLSPPKPTEISLTDAADFLIVRSPPFNGTVVNGKKVDVWDQVPSRVIPLSYLTKFQLSKSMDESYSFYMVGPAAFTPSSLQMIAESRYVFDQDAFDKYLYRPMTLDLFYTSFQDNELPTEKAESADIYGDSMDKANTLNNWNKLNDQYLSGSFTFMVPKDEALDPRIGEKLEIEGISDAYFYVEGVSHSWNYGGPLVSDVSVTRGYGKKSPIELKDRIFKRGKFLLGRDFV